MIVSKNGEFVILAEDKMGYDAQAAEREALLEEDYKSLFEPLKWFEGKLESQPTIKEGDTEVYAALSVEDTPIQLGWVIVRGKRAVFLQVKIFPKWDMEEAKQALQEAQNAWGEKDRRTFNELNWGLKNNPTETRDKILAFLEEAGHSSPIIGEKERELGFGWYRVQLPRKLRTPHAIRGKTLVPFVFKRHEGACRLVLAAMARR